MAKIYKILITLLFTSLMASCQVVGGISDASLFHDEENYQDISVAAIMNGDNNLTAKCDIKHNNFTYYKATAPFSMRVRKSHHPLYIQCGYDGFESERIKISSVDANKYETDHLATTSTRWKNTDHHPDWRYPSVIHIPLNDFENFYEHDHFYPDNAVPAGTFLSRNAGKIL